MDRTKEQEAEFVAIHKQFFGRWDVKFLGVLSKILRRICGRIIYIGYKVYYWEPVTELWVKDVNTDDYRRRILNE